MINMTLSKSNIKDVTSENFVHKNLETQNKTSKTDHLTIKTTDKLQHKEFLEEVVNLGKKKILLNKIDMSNQNNMLQLITNEKDYMQTVTQQDKLKLKPPFNNSPHNEKNHKEMINFEKSDLLYIMFCCCCQRCSTNVEKKFQIFDKITEYLDNYQEFNNIFKKQTEIELMKYLLFDKEQLKIFKYLLKPELSLHLKKEEDAVTNGRADSFSRYYYENLTHSKKDMSKKESEEIIAAFQTLIYKTSFSHADYKLVKNMQDLMNI